MTPYWLLEDETPIASTPLSGRADVEIVGAGSGCACAHALTAPGCGVCL
jgi:hypothetical protein